MTVTIVRTFCLQYYIGRPVIPPLFCLIEGWKGTLAIFVCFIKHSFKIHNSVFVLSLLFGVVLLSFVPERVQAGFLSSILGDDAHAETATIVPTQSNYTSGTIALLQANVSSISVLEDKNPGDDKKKDSNESNTGINANNIISDGALLPAIGPMGVYSGKDAIDPSSLETSVYVVRKGDSISTIADMFEVSINTILWANDMKKGDKLIEGDVLFILPISGLEHTVAKGQTIQSIAKLYKVDVNDIIFYNGLNEATKLAIGDELMIPDAVRSLEGDKPIANLGASIAKDKQYTKNSSLKNLAGYYVNPVPGYRKSQGIHDKNAVDFAIAKGTPIHASAAGRVTLARNGYNGGYGNLVIIAHPNGTETLYAHQSKIATFTGEQVSQGQIIGYIGSTGRSTGPHLHFEVHGARNPGVDGSWAN